MASSAAQRYAVAMLNRRTLFAAAALIGLPSRATAAAAEDWAGLSRYAADNRRRVASGERAGIVFLGDSITEGWQVLRPDFFGPSRVDRGISGQTTAQMLVRTMADVVALRPRVLHLMGGTNDIAGNMGPTTPEAIQNNLTAICRLARASGIAVLLASIPPADRFPWRPEVQPVAAIRAINAWAAGAASALDVRFVDYTPALATATGAMKPGMAGDGVHPTAAGFAAMEEVLAPTLRRLRV